MALPKQLPSSWLNVDLKVAIAAPVNRNGNLDFPTFSAKIVGDFEEVVELETPENTRLYPKNMIAYLVKEKLVQPAGSISLT